MSVLQRQTRPHEDDLLQIVCDSIASGSPIDPATVEEIERRSDAVTKAIKERLGVVNVAVDLVREAREE